jgi:hypothetical protein
MHFLVAAIILIALALVAIPILLTLLRGAGSILRILVKVAICLLLLCGIGLLITHFVL